MPTVTYYYQGPPQTEYDVDYVTYNTWATIWIGYVDDFYADPPPSIKASQEWQRAALDPTCLFLNAKLYQANPILNAHRP